jgi:hypothetical protein
LRRRTRSSLNRVGEPIHITPTRRLEAGLPEGLDSAVVMLDRRFAAAVFDEPGLSVFWGAYLTTTDEVLIAGPLGEVAAEDPLAVRTFPTVITAVLRRRRPAPGPRCRRGCRAGPPPLLAGVGDHGGQAAGAVVWQELRSHLLNSLHGQVQRRSRRGRPGPRRAA